MINVVASGQPAAAVRRRVVRVVAPDDDHNTIHTSSTRPSTLASAPSALGTIASPAGSLTFKPPTTHGLQRSMMPATREGGLMAMSAGTAATPRRAARFQAAGWTAAATSQQLTHSTATTPAQISATVPAASSAARGGMGSSSGHRRAPEDRSFFSFTAPARAAGSGVIAGSATGLPGSGPEATAAGDPTSSFDARRTLFAPTAPASTASSGIAATLLRSSGHGMSSTTALGSFATASSATSVRHDASAPLRCIRVFGAPAEDHRAVRQQLEVTCGAVLTAQTQPGSGTRGGGGSSSDLVIEFATAEAAATALRLDGSLTVHHRRLGVSAAAPGGATNFNSIHNTTGGVVNDSFAHPAPPANHLYAEQQQHQYQPQQQRQPESTSSIFRSVLQPPQDEPMMVERTNTTTTAGAAATTASTAARRSTQSLWGKMPVASRVQASKASLSSSTTSKVASSSVRRVVVGADPSSSSSSPSSLLHCPSTIPRVRLPWLLSIVPLAQHWLRPWLVQALPTQQ